VRSALGEWIKSKMREGSGQGLCDVDCLGRSGKQFHASRPVHGYTNVTTGPNGVCRAGAGVQAVFG
jgi:hypothetical protein